jgi:hypothetical protein
MTVSLKALSPEERDQWADILDAALGDSRRVTPEAVAEAAEALAAAPWGGILQWQMIQDAVRVALLAHAKAQARVMVGHNGRLVGKTSLRGVVTTTDDGRTEHQQVLWEEMTWAEFDRWRVMNAGQIEGLKINETAAAKLAALRDRAPGSTGPGDAAKQLGTTVAAVVGM